MAKLDLCFIFERKYDRKYRYSQHISKGNTLDENERRGCFFNLTFKVKGQQSSS